MFLLNTKMTLNRNSWMYKCSNTKSCYTIALSSLCRKCVSIRYVKHMHKVNTIVELKLVNTLLCILCWKYEWDVAYCHFTIAMTMVLSRGPRIKLTSWLSCDVWYFLSNWIPIESSRWVIDPIVLKVHPLSMHQLITMKSVGPAGISLERR